MTTKTTRAAKKSSPKKSTKPAAAEPTLAAVLGRRPGSAPKFGSVDPDDVSVRLAEVAKARDASAVPLLLEALAHQPDHTERSVVADTLLFLEDPRATEAVPAKLDLEHWAGGDLLREAVRAVFKLEPERAFDRLKSFFDQVSKAPQAHSIPGQHILAFLLDDYAPRDPDDPAWREARGVPRRVVERDRRWLDLAASLGHCSFSCLKHLPLHLLEAAKDPRLAEVALSNVAAVGTEKAIGFVERSTGKQAPSLLEAAAARKENAAFRKELLAAAKRSPKKR